jgi:hypothetical protein
VTVNNTNPHDSPAVDALVNITVWNHTGKKYITEKLHIATRKLLSPTRTGIFCLRRNGAKTGSGATYNSTRRKAMVNITDKRNGVKTSVSPHFKHQ